MPHPVLGEREGVDIVGRLARQPACLCHESRQVAVLPAEQRRSPHFTEGVHRRSQSHSDSVGFVIGEILDNPGDSLRSRVESGGVRGADISVPHVTGKPGDHCVQLSGYHLDPDESRGVVNHHQGKRGSSELFGWNRSLFLENSCRHQWGGQPGHGARTQAGTLRDADSGDGAVAQNRLHH